MRVDPARLDARMLVFSANRGKLVRNVPVQIEVERGNGTLTGRQITVTGEHAYVTVPGFVQGFNAEALAQVDLQSGKRRWQTPMRVCADGSRTAVARNADTIYACGCDGILRQLDPKSGQQRSEYGVGSCGFWDGWSGSGMFVAGPSGVALPITKAEFQGDEGIRPPRTKWGAAGGWDPGTWRVFMVPNTAFTTPVQSEPVDIGPDFIQECPGFGPPTTPLTIRIGGRLFPTNRQGHLHTTLTGRGIQSIDLAITPAIYDRCGLSIQWQHSLSLDGTAEPPVLLGARAVD
jgi:hypothetical protein